MLELVHAVNIIPSLDDEEVEEFTKKFIREQGGAILKLTARRCFDMLTAQSCELRPWKKNIKRQIKKHVLVFYMGYSEEQVVFGIYDIQGNHKYYWG